MTECPRCGGTKIGRLAQVADKDRTGTANRKIGMMEQGRFLGATILTTVGEVEAKICTDCGYFEEFVKDVKSIDWEKVEGFSWIE